MPKVAELKCQTQSCLCNLVWDSRFMFLLLGLAENLALAPKGSVLFPRGSPLQHTQVPCPDSESPAALEPPGTKGEWLRVRGPESNLWVGKQKD